MNPIKLKILTIHRLKLPYPNMSSFTQTPYNQYSQVCRYGVNCRHRNTCNYAHSAGQIRPIMCRYFSECKSQNCRFIHPDETNEEYFNRSLLLKSNSGKQKKQKLEETIEKQRTQLNTMIKEYKILVDQLKEEEEKANKSQKLAKRLRGLVKNQNNKNQRLLEKKKELQKEKEAYKGGKRYFTRYQRKKYMESFEAPYC